MLLSRWEWPPQGSLFEVQQALEWCAEMTEKMQELMEQQGGRAALPQGFEVAPETWLRFVREARSASGNAIFAGVLNAALIEQTARHGADREFPVPDAEEPGDLDDGIPF